MYRDVRSEADPESAWNHWRRSRDRLFAQHPQTPLDDSSGFSSLLYFPYDPAWRFVLPINVSEAEMVAIGNSDEGATPMVRMGTVTLPVEGEPKLSAFWMDQYGGGVFLPFADTTNGTDTYGGGRYLLDTAKGADLGGDGGAVVVDFNFAYHPSCVYSPRWSCPLPPQQNRLQIPVHAGERLA